MENAIHADGSLDTPVSRPVLLRIWEAVSETFSPFGGYPAVAVFHLRFWNFALAQGFSGLIPFFIVLVLVSPQSRVWVLGTLALKIFLGCLLSAFFVSRYYPVLVSAEGLRARNPAGIACRLSWDEIIEVRQVWWALPSQCVRISSPVKKDAIWLPLYLTDMQGFAGVVREHAPEGNPLRVFLERY